MTKEFCDICGRPIGTQPDGKIMNKRRGRPPKNDKRDNAYTFIYSVLVCCIVDDKPGDSQGHL